MITLSSLAKLSINSDFTSGSSLLIQLQNASAITSMKIGFNFIVSCLRNCALVPDFDSVKVKPNCKVDIKQVYFLRTAQGAALRLTACASQPHKYTCYMFKC